MPDEIVGYGCQVDPSRVCAITVTYADRFAYLQQVVVAAIASGVGKVIVVDNAASAQSREQMTALAQTSDGQVVVLSMAENLGSAGGFKAGLVYAMGQPGCDYFWLLDDDNVAGRDTLATLLSAYAELCDGCANGLVAVQCFREQRFFRGIRDRRRPIQARRSVFLGFHLALLGSLFRRRPLLHRRVRHTPDAQPMAAVEIPSGVYGGLLLSRELVQTIGYPNEDLYVYVDDTEYTHRISRAGGRLFLTPGSALHDVDRSFHMTTKPITFLTRMRQSLLARDPFRAYYATRNQAYFDRHMLRGSRLLYALNRSGYLSLLIVCGLWLGRVRRLRLMLGAIREGERGLLGRRDPLPDA